MTRLRHYDNLGTVRFVTFSCYHRYRLFHGGELIGLFLEELDSFRTRHRIKLYGYVVMPEHVHLVLLPPEDARLGLLIGELKSRSARRLLRVLRQKGNRRMDRLQILRGSRAGLAFWQARCYDHNCRTPESTRQKIAYCHKNPVTAGLVAHPRNWAWSSYNWYEGRRDVPILMDDFEL